MKSKDWISFIVSVIANIVSYYICKWGSTDNFKITSILRKNHSARCGFFGYLKLIFTIG